MGPGALTRSGQSGKQQFTARRVAAIDGVTQIAGGSKHVLALKSDGTLYLWGPAGIAGDRVFRTPTVFTTFGQP